ncbi:WD40 repeat domain-containing protein [Nocardia barduliensis]|uniref:WD40 repeat domain-containing protein n=1 Tax=Nocardia barduliensis TaxID=2736643 RepID=UPI0015740064|nr:WD40 repeat domain-containing protein [Nocardia barduliensis]
MPLVTTPGRLGRRRLLIGAAVAVPVTAATAAGIAIWWPSAPLRTSAVLTGHTGEVWSVAFDPAGARLATGSSDRTVRIWDVATPAHQPRPALDGRITITGAGRSRPRGLMDAFQ